MKDIIEIVFLFAAAIVICCAAIVITFRVADVREQEISLSCDTQEGGWKPPRISFCEKEMWDRIRGECDEQ
jgi:hypothetical protein